MGQKAVLGGAGGGFGMVNGSLSGGQLIATPPPQAEVSSSKATRNKPSQIRTLSIAERHLMCDERIPDDVRRQQTRLGGESANEIIGVC
jgi:hypothetical protein